MNDAPVPDPHHLLCDAATLASWYRQPGFGLVVVDTGFDLVDPAAGERAYGQSRLPGAFYAHLDRDLSAPKAPGRDPRGRHPLPARDALSRTVAAWGIGPTTQVLVYDRQGGMFAGRLWWLLRWIGHHEVAVLDGGWTAWQAAGHALETGPPTARRRSEAEPYPVGAPTVPVVDAEHVRRELGRVRLVDARAPERFRGEVEPLDPVAGHIPGAMNRFFQCNLQADGRFKAPAVLRRELGPMLGVGGREVVHQCGSGVTACHNVLAQAVAGLGLGALYPGSWSEWCADPTRPVARG